MPVLKGKTALKTGAHLELAKLTLFFDYPADIRKVIYTTNAIESVNLSIRKITKTHASFRPDEAVFKLFNLALNNISQKWTMTRRD